MVVTPRAGDGRISRSEAAFLACVDEKTITAWVARGHLVDVRRENRRVWLNPVEVIETEYRLHHRERSRIRRVLAGGAGGAVGLEAA